MPLPVPVSAATLASYQVSYLVGFINKKLEQSAFDKHFRALPVVFGWELFGNLTEDLTFAEKMRAFKLIQFVYGLQGWDVRWSETGEKFIFNIRISA